MNPVRVRRKCFVEVAILPADRFGAVDIQRRPMLARDILEPNTVARQRMSIFVESDHGENLTSAIMMRPVSTDETIQRAADGDQAAWDEIVRTYWRKVFNVAYRFVGTYEEAEDLTQEIFLKVFRSLNTFDRRANFQTWLISVSRNFCIDRYRSGRRDREVFAREVDASTVQAEAPGINAHARVELQDRVALLREALRALSPPLRTAVLLRDVHELSYQEIADQLGVAEGTVKSRINRGRAELARQIEALRAKTEGVSK